MTRFTTSGGDVCIGTARISIAEAWRIMAIFCDEMAAAMNANDRLEVANTIKITSDLMAAIRQAMDWKMASGGICRD